MKSKESPNRRFFDIIEYMKKFSFLRKKYPQFIYKDYSYRVVNNNLKIVFKFRIEPDIRFRPEIIIKNIPESRLKRIGEKAINNFVFHLGLIEMLSYWKATCSPEIFIGAGYLDKEQIKWWQDLIIKGMGQFFYENKIDWRSANFLKITSNPRIEAKSLGNLPLELKDRYLVPLGGGKDSIVTLEYLKDQGESLNCFLLNPIQAAKKVVKSASIKNPIIVERKIDPALLKLNKQGYLNGHTPFTALLSFLSVFCAALFNYQHVAFSNEKSADEGNVSYRGKIINHQYSKSSEFERKFKAYCKKYLADNIHYFSFLRRYTELTIAKIFSKYPKYFSVFSSCNVASKIGERWCGKCPKCLFVYTVLYPFLEKKQLLKIFGQDLFKKRILLPIMKSLIGQGRHKPFECVGTYQESRIAFKLSLKKAKKLGKIPYLLTKI